MDTCVGQVGPFGSRTRKARKNLEPAWRRAGDAGDGGEVVVCFRCGPGLRAREAPASSAW